MSSKLPECQCRHRKKRKEKFTLFSNHNGSLLRQQPGGCRHSIHVQLAYQSLRQATAGAKAHLPQETSSLGSQHMKGSAAHHRVHPHQQSHEWLCLYQSIFYEQPVDFFFSDLQKIISFDQSLFHIIDICGDL